MAISIYFPTTTIPDKESNYHKQSAKNNPSDPNPN